MCCVSVSTSLATPIKVTRFARDAHVPPLQAHGGRSRAWWSTAMPRIVCSKTYQTPRRPFEKTRLDQELKIIGKFSISHFVRSHLTVYRATRRPVWTKEQARSMACQVHAGQDQKSCSRIAYFGREEHSALIRRQRSPPSACENWSTRRI